MVPYMMFLINELPIYAKINRGFLTYQYILLFDLYTSCTSLLWVPLSYKSMLNFVLYRKLKNNTISIWKENKAKNTSTAYNKNDICLPKLVFLWQRTTYVMFHTQQFILKWELAVIWLFKILKPITESNIIYFIYVV